MLTLVRRHWLLFFLFCCGVALLCLNGIGQLMPLRYPALGQERLGTPQAATMDHQEALRQLDPLPGEGARAYAVRANGVVNAAMAFYWEDEGVDSHRLRLPIWENYLFWIAGHLWPKKYAKWEFADLDKALERGVGLCSQHAIVITKTLIKHGVKAHIVTLKGHVVSTAQVAPDTWYILDADYGVVLPFGIREVHQNPARVAPYYRAQGYNDKVIGYMLKSYEYPRFVVDPTGATHYTRFRAAKERLFYTGIWVIPPLLMLPFMTVLLVNVLRRRRGT